MTFVVAVTGGIGSGKTAVSDLLHQHGAAVVDTDVIARELTAPGGAAMAPLRDTFGPNVQAADGSMDRAAMRQLVFSDASARQRLEAILHPMIRAEAARQVGAAQAPYVVLVIPLLVESKSAYAALIDRTLVVDCPEHVQVERTMRRSGLSRTEAERIVSSQATRAERLALADDVVVNDGTLDSLAAEIARLHATYLTAARAKAGR
jgi:dephospho-CoA kinase